jgi:hypothetical protein
MRLRLLSLGAALLTTLSLAGCCHPCKTCAQRPVVVGSAPVGCPCPNGGCGTPPAAVPPYSPPYP